MAKKQAKAFEMKGTNLVTFAGEAKWCKYLPSQLNRHERFSPKGDYSVHLIINPDDKEYQAFVNKINVMLEQLKEEILDDSKGVAIPAKDKKNLVAVDLFKPEIEVTKDDNGNVISENETGNIDLLIKLNNVDDKKKGQDYVKFIGEGNRELLPRTACPEIGNGSIVRCKVYANPYFMPSQKTAGIEIPARYGVSLSWNAIKVIKLNEYHSDGEDFDEDEGISLDEVASQTDDVSDF